MMKTTLSFCSSSCLPIDLAMPPGMPAFRCMAWLTTLLRPDLRPRSRQVASEIIHSRSPSYTWRYDVRKWILRAYQMIYRLPNLHRISRPTKVPSLLVPEGSLDACALRLTQKRSPTHRSLSRDVNMRLPSTWNPEAPLECSRIRPTLASSRK